MLKVLLRHGFLTSAVLILIVCSIICQIIIGVYYHSMLQATENMTATDNQLLKQCKTKFINCYQINGGVLNVSVFVDKFLSKIRFMGMSLNAIYRLGGQLILLSVFVCGVGICRLIVSGNDISELIPFYVISILGLYGYFSVCSLVDMNGRKKELKINLVDYLENHMVVRISDVSTLADKTKEKREKKEEIREHSNQGQKLEKKIFSKKEEEQLRNLLKELFAAE